MNCDIAIVGGGLAGASLAVALAPLGYDIKVIWRSATVHVEYWPESVCGIVLQPMPLLFAKSISPS